MNYMSVFKASNFFFSRLRQAKVMQKNDFKWSPKKALRVGCIVVVVLLSLNFSNAQTKKPGKNTSAATASSAKYSGDANSPEAQKIEKLALRIFGTDAIRRGIEQGVVRYSESSTAQKPDGAKYIKSAVTESAMFASLCAAMGGVSDPAFIWMYAAPRTWNGYTIPGCRWYADNVDTYYRTLRVDVNSSYEIKVYPTKKMPAQLSFMVYNWLQHDGMDPRNDVPLGTITVDEKTPRNADGSITLTAGSDPANGRSTHIQLKPGAQQILAREIRGEWELPAVRLSVKRTAGPEAVSKSFEELTQEAAKLLDDGVNATLNMSVGFGQLAENQPGQLRVRWIEETGSNTQKLAMDEAVGPDKALGFLTSFNFNLKEDEALIVTLNMLDCKYVGINTYRPFVISPEHVYHTSSLNNYQSKPNPDGSYTSVFARKDPGVYNWLDFSGIPYGVVAVRWQNLTKPVVGDLKHGVQKVKLVKLSDLRNEMPAGTNWITSDERKKQQAERAKLFKNRTMGTPCEVGGELDKMY